MMMQEFITEITPALWGLLQVLVLALIGYLTPKAKKLLEDNGVIKELEKYDYIADLAVKAVEQMYQNEGGEAKKDEAIQRFIEFLSDKAKIQITDVQVETLIESAVKRMKDEATQVTTTTLIESEAEATFEEK